MTNYWREQMDEPTAREVLGDRCFEEAVARGAGYCAARQWGAWEANLQESYAAYGSAMRVAEARAAGVAA